jgi:hypothetical protein
MKRSPFAGKPAEQSMVDAPHLVAAFTEAERSWRERES